MGKVEFIKILNQVSEKEIGYLKELFGDAKECYPDYGKEYEKQYIFVERLLRALESEKGKC